MSNKYQTDGSSVVDEMGRLVCSTLGSGCNPKGIADALNAFESKPVLSELDQLAVDFYASGRTLKVEYKERHATDWEDIGDLNPSFNPCFEWRRKPTTETQVWYVMKHQDDPELTRIHRQDEPATKPFLSQGWKIVGTLTGEVEI